MLQPFNYTLIRPFIYVHRFPSLPLFTLSSSRFFQYLKDEGLEFSICFEKKVGVETVESSANTSSTTSSSPNKGADGGDDSSSSGDGDAAALADVKIFKITFSFPSK